MPVTIAPEHPDTPDAAALITELEAHLAAGYPAESRHGYSIEQLIQQGVAFFVTRVDGQPAGCGGIQFFGTEFGELKRMYVRPGFRCQGLARRMVNHLVAHARANGVKLVRLETGINQHAAIALYKRAGFRKIPPFPPYLPDPLSQCYEKSIA